MFYAIGFLGLIIILFFQDYLSGENSSILFLNAFWFVGLLIYFFIRQYSEDKESEEKSKGDVARWKESHP